MRRRWSRRPSSAASDRPSERRSARPLGGTRRRSHTPRRVTFAPRLSKPGELTFAESVRIVSFSVLAFCLSSSFSLLSCATWSM